MEPFSRLNYISMYTRKMWIWKLWKLTEMCEYKCLLIEIVFIQLNWFSVHLSFLIIRLESSTFQHQVWNRCIFSSGVSSVVGLLYHFMLSIVHYLRYIWYRPTPSVVVQWLTLVPYIREVPGSSLVPETGYPDMLFLVLLSLQANTGIVPRRPVPLPSTLFLIHHSPITHSFDAR
jgi:hypothetical protein